MLAVQGGDGEFGGGKWSQHEDAQLKAGVEVVGAKNWKHISETYLHGQRSDVQCLHRWQKVLRPGLVKVHPFLLFAEDNHTLYSIVGKLVEGRR